MRRKGVASPAEGQGSLWASLADVAWNGAGEAPQGCGNVERTAGIDEAGRGCLAGPVVAAAVVLPVRYDLPGLKDSKQCTPHSREMLAPQIQACAVTWGLGLVWPRGIDALNILQATLEAMSRAVRVLRFSPCVLLVDGNVTIPRERLAAQWYKKHTAPLPVQRAIVRGDRRVPAIAAASILAKTFRDRLMRGLARRWPGYGFEQHKGYGTAEHLEALRRLGPCPQHRLTFRGVLPQGEASAQTCLLL